MMHCIRGVGEFTLYYFCLYPDLVNGFWTPFPSHIAVHVEIQTVRLLNCNSYADGAPEMKNHLSMLGSIGAGD